MLGGPLSLFLLMHSLCFANSIIGNTPFGPSLPPYFYLNQHIEKEIEGGSVVGTGVAIIEQGHVRFIKAYGHLKKGQPAKVSPQTIFQTGSSTKPLTATLFLLAQKRKNIDFTTPIILPGCKISNLEARHILSHTSGFKREGWNWQIEHGASRHHLLALFAKKTHYGVGSFFDYHNVAFSLIEEPLAKAFKMPFNRAMQVHLFNALGMKRSTIGFLNFQKQNNRAWPHERAKNGAFIASENYSSRYHETVASSGGVNASITDMAQFLLLHLGGFPRIATAKELEALHSPVCLAPDAQRWFKNHIKGPFSCHYGYGWRIVNDGKDIIVFHGGWLKGFASIMAFSKQQKKGIVILSNTESPFAFSTAMAFLLNKFGS